MIGDIKIKCTVEVLTRNSAATLVRCLESLKDFGEILVLDGNSTDGTFSIAKTYGARIEKQFETDEPSIVIKNFSEVRNKGLELAKNDWFLFVDSDEYLSDSVVQEIQNIIEHQNPPYWIWNIPRKYVDEGGVIECATTYPNFQTRFFHRAHVSEFKKEVHERIEPFPGEQTGTLRHPLFVPLPDMRDAARKRKHYIAIETLRMEQNTKRELLKKIANTLKASLLYAIRLLKLPFCRGRVMPFAYEWSRHQYNFRLLLALFFRLLLR